MTIEGDGLERLEPDCGELVEMIMASVANQAISVTAHGRKNGARGGMPHQEQAILPGKYTMRKYACLCDCAYRSWPSDSTSQKSHLMGDAHDANDEPACNLKLE